MCNACPRELARLELGTNNFKPDLNAVKKGTRPQKEGREVTGEMGLKLEYEMFALQVNLNIS